VPRSANCTTPPSCDRLDDLNKSRLAPPQMSSKNVRRIAGMHWYWTLCASSFHCPPVCMSASFKIRVRCMCCLLSYSRRPLAKPTQFEIQPRNCCCFPLPFRIELQNSLLRSYISPLQPKVESSKYDNLKYTVY
jgi:hypothetical protein